MSVAAGGRLLLSGLRCQFSALSTVPAVAVGTRNYSAPRKTGLIEFLDLDPPDVPPGRSWTMSELKLKSFEDLHKLWYVCYKEQNMLLSEQARQKFEGKRVPKWGRMKSVKQTMARIKHVLADRAKEKIDRAKAMRESSITFGAPLDSNGLQRVRELTRAGKDELARINAK